MAEDFPSIAGVPDTGSSGEFSAEGSSVAGFSSELQLVFSKMPANVVIDALASVEIA